MAATKAQRSWGMTITWVVVAVICGGASAWFGQWAWNNDGWRDFVGWPLGILFGIGALISVIGIFTASGRAACPSCGKSLVGFDATKSGGDLVVMCESCKAYCQLVGTDVRPVAEDHVHSAPVFTTELHEQVRWPGCVVCNAAPARELIHELKIGQTAKNVATSAAGLALVAVAGAGFVQWGGGKLYRVPVPYCPQHEQGVALDTDMGTPVIRFRSLPAFRAFCQANGVAPRLPPV